MERKYPILAWVSLDPAGVSAFGRVTRDLMKRLPGWGKAVIAISDEKIEPQMTRSYMTYHTPSMGGVRYFLEKLQPDLIVVYGAFWHMGTYYHAMKDWMHKTLMYLVVDCPFTSKRVNDILPRYRRVMVPTKYNQDILKEIDVESDIVPHAVDTRLFKPRDEKPGIYTVGGIMSNNMRKQIPRLLKSLTYLKDIDIKCNLLTRPRVDQAERQGFMLDEMIINWDLEDIVSFRKEGVLNIGIPTNEMPSVYNNLTVQTIPTAGEAFLIPLIEAGAMGIPSIVTDVPGPREVMGDASLYCKVDGTLHLQWGDLALVDPVDMAKNIRLLYEDADWYEELSTKSIERSKQYTWERAVDSLHVVLEEELEKL
jgi:glycosyltransferase involved in cell wall biosynthesis